MTDLLARTRRHIARFATPDPADVPDVEVAAAITLYRRLADEEKGVQRALRDHRDHQPAAVMEDNAALSTWVKEGRNGAEPKLASAKKNEVAIIAAERELLAVSTALDETTKELQALLATRREELVSMFLVHREEHRLELVAALDDVETRRNAMSHIDALISWTWNAETSKVAPRAATGARSVIRSYSEPGPRVFVPPLGSDHPIAAIMSWLRADAEPAAHTKENSGIRLVEGRDAPGGAA